MSLDDNISAAESLFRLLQEGVLVGGFAMNLHGSDRLTVDIDVIYPLDQDAWSHLISAFRDSGRIRPPHGTDWAQLQDWDWLARHAETSPNLRFVETTTGLKVDVMFAPSLEYQQMRLRAHIWTPPGSNVELRYASVRDLRRMKQDAVAARNAPKDRFDLDFLKKLARQQEQEHSR